MSVKFERHLAPFRVKHYVILNVILYVWILILTFYLLITIVQRFFLQLQILWWEYLMLSVNILYKQPLSSTRIKSSNIAFIRHKLSLSCGMCDFIKHKGSFEGIIF